MSDCYKDACGKCGTVGLRIPDDEGSSWAFDGGALICRDEKGVIAHPHDSIP